MKDMKKWLKCAGIRALRTVVQTAAAALGTEAVFSEIDWLTVLCSSLLAGALSMITSLSGLPECREESHE